MSLFADTPEPPYYAVIFASTCTEGDNGYSDMANRMVELASKQSGFLGVESAREDVGITVSYRSDLESIQKWRDNIEHQEARQLGYTRWYSSFKLRIAKVERDYSM